MDRNFQLVPADFSLGFAVAPFPWSSRQEAHVFSARLFVQLVLYPD
jgi:hypothetical protein